ncbi:MAG: DUF4845 domain-containing protein [Gammaproteobacteria bacterium]
MRNGPIRQQGITLTGLIFAAVLVGGAAVLAMRLFPLYNEKMKIDLALDKVASDPAIGDQTKTGIVTAVMKQFEVSDVDRWSTVEFTRLLDVSRDPETKHRVMSLEYEIRNELCCDLDIVLNYFWSRELPDGSVE